MKLARDLAIVLLAGGLTVVSRSGAALGQTTDGVQALQQDAAVQMTKGNVQGAVGIITDALRDVGLQAERRAMLLNDRGVAYAQLGQTKLAVEDFNRAVQLFPEHAPIYNNRGSLLLSVGLVREAVKDFDRAIVLAGGYAAAYNNRAAAHVRLGETAQAVADYTRAIELLPQSAAPLVGRGRAYLIQGLPHAAIRDFSRAVNADQRFASSYRSRAEAKLVVARAEDAIEDLSRAVAFDAQNPEIFVLRGQAYLANRNAVAAVKDFQRAVELSPRLLVAYQSLGLAHAEAEAFEEALADLNRALEIEPRNAVTYAYRAYVYKRSKQVEIGLKDLQTALRIDANAAEALWAKGEFAAEAGREEDAIGDLRRAVAVKPGFRPASDALERLGADAVQSSGELEIPSLGIDRWRVVAQGERFFAVHADVKTLRVPLEMMGPGQPKLLEWDAKKGELKGIGTLRYHAGTLSGKSGGVPFEQVAIVDMTSASVVAVEPHRLGDKLATWTWDDGKVTIASVDGVKDEFVLRRVKPKEQVAASQQPRPRPRSDSDWAPWNQPPSGYGSQQASRSRPSKPKSFFELLFGN